MTGNRKLINQSPVSGTILNNVLQKGLKARFSPELISQITSSAFALGNLDLSAEDKALISTVYMRGILAIFGSYAFLMTILFVLALFVEDYGLSRKEDPAQENRSSTTTTTTTAAAAGSGSYGGVQAGGGST